LWSVHLSADNIRGEEVWGKLDSIHLGPEHLREGHERSRFRKTGDPFEKDVSVSEKRYQQPVDKEILTDYRFVKLCF
jgi:hypothetical protein